MAYAPGTTKKQYDRHWFKWIQFQRLWHGRFGTYLKPSEWAFQKYAVWRFNNPTRGKRIMGSSIRTEISAINSYLCNHGYKLDISLMTALKRQCLGMDKAVVEETHTRAPRKLRRAMVNTMLDPMILALDASDWDMRVAKAALAMGKACGFRPDHYLCGPSKRYFKIRQLTWLPQPTVNCNKLLLKFDGSKTNQLRKMEQRSISCRCPKPCAVHLLFNICKHRLDRPYEPVLLTQSGSRFKNGDMVRVLDTLCYEFFLDRRYYTPYCLRVGAACEEWWAGACKSSIMSKYGWESQSSCDRYLRETNIDLARFLPCNVEVPYRKP